ncbi:hypothetical protein LJC55_02490 [Eubacteriales bacterium OttesenSCG-928-N14]|nr:hypothetical protein [Eubacteriales bacterium OttesenSCG-928-N14]
MYEDVGSGVIVGAGVGVGTGVGVGSGEGAGVGSVVGVGSGGFVSSAAKTVTPKENKKTKANTMAVAQTMDRYCLFTVNPPNARYLPDSVVSNYHKYILKMPVLQLFHNCYSNSANCHIVHYDLMKIADRFQNTGKC